VRARLDLPMPPLGGGTTAITNLYLGAALELRFLPEFNLAAAFALGRRERPFNITIFILGGGGWIELSARYFPFSGRMELDCDIGLEASASLDIALGPISGSVGIALGATFLVQVRLGERGGSGIKFSVRLRIWGEVSLLGIVSAGIYLMLEISYANHCLTATGTLKISVKIGPFFEINIDESITYSLGSCSGQAAIPWRRPGELAGVANHQIPAGEAGDGLLAASILDAVRSYTRMLEE